MMSGQKGSDLIETNAGFVAKFSGHHEALFPLNSSSRKANHPPKRGGAFRNAINNRQKHSDYGLTSKIISKSLQKRNNLSTFCLAAHKNNNMLQRCVSETNKNSRTQMAIAKQTSKLFGAATGAVMAAAAALSPSASFAQEATPAAYTFPEVTEEMHAEEMQQLLDAERGSHEFAMSCPETHDCVGIILHIGDDARRDIDLTVRAYFREKGIDANAKNLEKGRKIVTEDYIAHYSSHYAEKFEAEGVHSKLFPRVNYRVEPDKPVGTGVSFKIGDVLYTTQDNKSYIGVGTSADSQIPRVADALDYVWQQIEKNRQISALDTDLSLAQN